jgi:hypothetical protein
MRKKEFPCGEQIGHQNLVASLLPVGKTCGEQNLAPRPGYDNTGGAAKAAKGGDMWCPIEKFEGFPEVGFLEGWGLMTPSLLKYGVNIALTEPWGSVNNESHPTRRWYPLDGYELRYAGSLQEEDSVEEYYILAQRRRERENEKRWGRCMIERQVKLIVLVREKYFPDYAVLCRFRSLPRSLQRWLKSPPWERVPSSSEGFHFAQKRNLLLPKK